MLFYNPFGITFISKLNLSSSCIIRCESQFSKLWNSIVNLSFNLTLILQSLALILQSLCAEPSYFPVT